MRGASAGRREFEKQLRAKYSSAAASSTKSNDVSSRIRVVDEDALLYENNAPTKDVETIIKKGNGHGITANFEDDGDDDEDAAFVRQAIKEEMARQKLDPSIVTEKKQKKPEVKKEEVEAESSYSGAKRRIREDDFSSDDEIQRPVKSSKGSNDKIAQVSEDSGQRTTYRDKYGRRITESEWRAGLNDRKRRKDETKPSKKPQIEKISEKDLAWGGGLVQKRLEEERKKYEEEVAKEPFSRYEVSEAYDAEMKDKTLWEDPLKDMLKTESKDQSKSTQDTMKERRRFPAPPNRYHILPGTHWDGRVRGTGFEERYLNAVGNKHNQSDGRSNDYSYATD